MLPLVLHHVAITCPEGTVLAPVRAACLVLQKVAVPALGVAVLHKCSMWLRRRFKGVVGILQALESGDMIRQLEALERLIISASNDAFVTEFMR